MTNLRPKQLVFGVFAIVGMVLLIRMIWHVSPMDTGWDQLRIQCYTTVAGVVGQSYTPIGHREPDEQANYWLREVDRVVSKNPHDALVHLGAALVLDSPCNNYRYKYMRLLIGNPWLATADTGVGANAAELEFTNRCSAKSLQLAQKACSLDSTNKALWQSLALLLTNYSMFQDNESVRTDQWESILAECRQHDPDNGLYDYVAASILWQGTTDWELSDNEYEPDRLIILDQNRFDRSMTHFRNGLAKPTYSLDETMFEATWHFLSKSRLPRIEYADITSSRTVALRQTRFLLGQLRDVGRLSRFVAQDGDVAYGLGLHRMILRVYDQFASGELNGSQNERLLRDLQFHRLAVMQFDVQHLRELLPPDDAQQLLWQEYDVRIRSALLQEAQQEHISAQAIKTGIDPTVLMDEFITAITTATTFAWAVELFALYGLLWWVRTGSAPPVGIIRTVLALVVSLVICIVLFALAPAELIDRDWQNTGFTVSLVLLVPLAIGTIAVWSLRKRRYRMSLRWLLVVMALGCLLFAVGSLWTRLGWLPQDLHMPARDTMGISLDNLRFASTSGPVRTNVLACLHQWHAYRASLWTLLLWIGLVAVLAVWRQSCGRRDSNQDTRSSWSDIAKSVAGSVRSVAVTAALLLLLVYLAVVPGSLTRGELAYQQMRDEFQHRNQIWKAIDERVQQWQLDPAKMEAVHQRVLSDMHSTRQAAEARAEEMAAMRRKIQFPER
ncbi:MAG: hypothetical protein KDA87_21665 [Planctomycetales bacterium]|nr:hypothetical protein [Planctomycetales bacterium]